MTNTLRNDLEYITNSGLDWDKLRDSSVLITGATGLIGGLLIRALRHISETYGLNISIYAAVRDIERAKQTISLTNINYISGDIAEIKPPQKLDYIVHCAAVTKSSEMISDPCGNINTAVNGTRNILEIARDCGAKSVVYLSSMEVYGSFGADAAVVTEDMLGYVDLTSPRSCYPEGKRMCEMLCTAYFSQHNVPIKVARLAQTFGAGVPKTDNRVFAQFAKSAVAKTDIVMHTNGDGMGNYVYTADCITAILTLLLGGDNGATYNIANPKNAMTIRDMAETVAREVSPDVSGQIKVIFDIPTTNTHGYAPPVKWRLSADKMMSLGWSPKYSMYDMYRNMIDDWTEDWNKKDENT